MFCTCWGSFLINPFVYQNIFPRSCTCVNIFSSFTRIFYTTYKCFVVKTESGMSRRFPIVFISHGFHYTLHYNLIQISVVLRNLISILFYWLDNLSYCNFDFEYSLRFFFLSSKCGWFLLLLSYHSISFKSCNYFFESLHFASVCLEPLFWGH